MRLTPLVLALPIALATSLVRADPTSDLQELLGQTVLSTASKTAEIGSLAPATSSTITAGELRRYGIRTVAEAINFLSMGMTASDRLLGVEVGARGVLINGDYDAHVLLLVNGHAVNEPWGGSSAYDRGAGVPIELVDHIEVILGPGSVMYGSSAMLGVVNVVTKRARDYEGVHFIAEGELFTSVRVGAGAGVEFKLFGVPSELSFQIEYAAQRGPTFRLGPQPYGVDAVTGQPKSFSPGNPTGIWGGDATKSYWSATPAALSRLVIGNFEINARFFQYRRSQPGLDLQSVQVGDFNAVDNYESDHEVSLDIAHHATLSETVQLRTRLYGDLYRYNWFATTSGVEDCSGSDPRGCREHLQGTARWAGLEIQPTVDWFHDGSFVTMVGVDGRIRYVASETDEVDSTGRNRIEFDSDEHLEPSMGVYGQQTFQATKWLGFSAGARGDIDPRYHAVHVSPRAAVTVSPWHGGTLRAIYSEAFRAPSAFEAYYTSVQQAWAKNPDLMPELVRGVEASLEQRFGSQRIFFGAFRSWWSGLILLQTLTGPDLDKVIAAGNIAPGTTSASQYQNEAPSTITASTPRTTARSWTGACGTAPR